MQEQKMLCMNLDDFFEDSLEVFGFLGLIHPLDN